MPRKEKRAKKLSPAEATAFDDQLRCEETLDPSPPLRRASSPFALLREHSQHQRLQTSWRTLDSALQRASEIERLKMLYQAACALEEMHKDRLLHGDVCCKNILVDKKFQVCLTGFEHSSEIEMAAATSDSAPPHWSPERKCSPETWLTSQTGQDTYSFAWMITLLKNPGDKPMLQELPPELQRWVKQVLQSPPKGRESLEVFIQILGAFLQKEEIIKSDIQQLLLPFSQLSPEFESFFSYLMSELSLLKFGYDSLCYAAQLTLEEHKKNQSPEDFLREVLSEPRLPVKLKIVLGDALAASPTLRLSLR